jgi:hypothetical protein
LHWNAAIESLGFFSEDRILTRGWPIAVRFVKAIATVDATAMCGPLFDILRRRLAQAVREDYCV